uniref:Putative secreted protein n=1 Tax=Anopheles darlingi TaxID=43151 RepID=A0A2M4DDP6_ANODA
MLTEVAAAAAAARSVSCVPFASTAVPEATALASVSALALATPVPPSFGGTGRWPLSSWVVVTSSSLL